MATGSQWLSSAIGSIAIAAVSTAAPAAAATATPIKHLVVIFQENVSFDHYFGTTLTRIIYLVSPYSRRDPILRLSMGLALGS